MLISTGFACSSQVIDKERTAIGGGELQSTQLCHVGTSEWGHICGLHDFGVSDKPIGDEFVRRIFKDERGTNRMVGSPPFSTWRRTEVCYAILDDDFTSDSIPGLGDRPKAQGIAIFGAKLVHADRPIFLTELAAKKIDHTAGRAVQRQWCLPANGPDIQGLCPFIAVS